MALSRSLAVVVGLVVLGVLGAALLVLREERDVAPPPRRVVIRNEPRETPPEDEPPVPRGVRIERGPDDRSTGIVQLPEHDVLVELVDPGDAPVAGAALLWWTDDEADTREATTADDGRVTLRVPGDRLYVLVPGFAVGRRTFARFQTSAGLPREGALRLQLREGVVTRGTVRAKDGTLVADAEITFSRAAGARTDRERVRSGTGGAFELNLPAGEPWEVQVLTPSVDGHAFRYARWSQESYDPRKGALDVVLDPGATLRGRLLPDDGADVAGRDLQVWRDRLPFAAEPVAQLRTADDGTFVATGLDAGTYRLELRDDAGWLLEGALELPADGAARELRVTRAATLAGVVRAADGGPWMRGRVVVRVPLRRFETHVVTDDRGRFEAAGVPPGECEVIAMVPGEGELRGGPRALGTFRTGEGEIEARIPAAE